MIPRRSEIMSNARIQMEGLCEDLKWSKPDRYALRPIVSPYVLVHWRYQVLFSQYLLNEQLSAYMCFGLDFMTNIDNLEKSPLEYAKTYSLIARVLAMREELSVDMNEETNEIEPTTVDGKLAESDRRIMVRKRATSEEPVIPVKRSKQEHSSEPRVQKRSMLDVFDSHFHLDRASTRISGNPTAITEERLLGEQMERPPVVLVNIKGGLLIFCDPETYLETVPFDSKWKVAIGLTPRKYMKHHHRQNTCFGFTHLITKFDQQQIQALRYIPVNRLLAETDASYMPPRGIRINTPIHVGEVVEKLATLRYVDLQTIASATLGNAMGIFK
ncbi:unnamed protein product [Mytilus coruscus]|uniref:TatD n=1 Tax=Mytilus coruscus TaxID=42192 RepID=A0A6J8EY68_MYTCO|nr:unnamed protein product [Mytilus coruscus]